MTTALFIIVLNMSITASVVALFVTLIRIPLKKVPKIYSYVLWSVVLFRFLCPVNFGSGFSLMPAEAANIIPQDMIFYDNPERQSTLFTQYIVKYEIETGHKNTIPPKMPPAYLPGTQTALKIAGYVWPCGVIILLAYAAIGYIRLKRSVYYSTLVRDNIYETDCIETPFVLGFIHPKIYLPSEIEPLQLELIVKHERTHIKRGDYLIKPLAYATLALHWFNPLVWLCYFLMTKDMEMSCDEAVLQKADGDIRHDYSSSLLHFSSKRTGLIYPLAFGENNAKSRIKNILYFRRPTAWIVIVSILVIIPFSVGFTFNADLSTVGQKVIDGMDIKEITAIGVSAVEPYQGRMIEDSEQIREIVGLIKALNIQKIYFPMKSSTGQLVQYEIYMESDKMTVMGIYGNHIVINGQWYIANDESCERLSVLGVELVGPISERITGMENTGITVDNYITMEVSDDIREKIINLVRKEFIDNYGMSDGEEMNALKREYIKSAPEDERVHVSWTLNQIGLDEAQRLMDIARERFPDWQYGQSFDRSVFDDVIFTDDIR